MEGNDKNFSNEDIDRLFLEIVVNIASTGLLSSEKLLNIIDYYKMNINDSKLKKNACAKILTMFKQEVINMINQYKREFNLYKIATKNIQGVVNKKISASIVLGEYDDNSKLHEREFYFDKIVDNGKDYNKIESLNYIVESINYMNINLLNMERM